MDINTKSQLKATYQGGQGRGQGPTRENMWVVYVVWQRYRDTLIELVTVAASAQLSLLLQHIFSLH